MLFTLNYEYVIRKESKSKNTEVKAPIFSWESWVQYPGFPRKISKNRLCSYIYNYPYILKDCHIIHIQQTNYSLSLLYLSLLPVIEVLVSCMSRHHHVTAWEPPHHTTISPHHPIDHHIILFAPCNLTRSFYSSQNSAQLSYRHTPLVSMGPNVIPAMSLNNCDLVLSYIFPNVDECWLTSFIRKQRFKLQISLNYAVIKENVVSERVVVALTGVEMTCPMSPMYLLL